ncbi:penicillin-binding protein [Corynebacterium aurimucosum]|uniref:transglycosylase domain-containing protein n=1 Tax=Corynebacterium aurimucosum TaxID=169292 RepID=UPI00191CB1CA|nr:transglycosylase domain-containing protein [Corynebacterium aurimucosum]QQU96174.1 penicillin-binding protein [Corynebacterium aurimucosum]UTA70939.1 penicillin-binding protein [Corynebacterium aurimucosum]WJY71569.1 Penicillin-binding protein 1A [Corynebacterium aurimucosum]
MTEKETSGRKSGKSRKSPSRSARHSSSSKRRWPWIVLTVLFVLVGIPALLFGFAYTQYDVPEPEELQPSQISTIVAGDGETQLAKLVPPEGNRRQVTLDEIPDYVEGSVLAAEDREFWTNSGFSFTGLGRAVLGKLTGDSTAGGGSTITQQYVKNTLVGDEYSYVRKIRELIYSVKMTNEWSKEEILNAYLNTVYFGRNAYGIEAASNAYFNKDAKDLTVEEGAMLAGLIQSPSVLDPWVDEERSQARWNYVMDGLVEMGDLDATERSQMAFPETRDPSEYSAYTEAPGAYGHIKNQVTGELARVGITEDQLATGGLKVTTTIDMTVQNASTDAAHEQLAVLQEDARAAAVTIDPATGAVRGYFGGDDSNGWDYANSPLQTGSVFKIMALAAALQQGIDLNTYYSSAPYQLPGSQTVTNVGGGCGSCSIAEALKNSYNTSFLRLQDDLENKMQDTADMAHALGVARSLPGIEKTLTENGGTPYEGVVLGQYQSRPLDMATAMATLTNQGVWHQPHFVQKVENAAGEVLYENPTDGGERRVSANVANNVISAMQPIAAWSNGALAGGRPSASKTGTTQLGDTGTNKDAWMVGSTPQLATAVWVGTADNTSAIFNQWGGIMYGSDAPTKIWKSILDTSLANVEQQSFPQAYPIHYGVGSWGSGYVYDPSQSTTWNQAPASPENEGDEEAPAEDGEHHDEGQGETPDQPAQPEQPAQPAEPEVPSLDDILNGDRLDQLLGQ